MAVKLDFMLAMFAGCVIVFSMIDVLLASVNPEIEKFGIELSIKDNTVLVY